MNISFDLLKEHGNLETSFKLGVAGLVCFVLGFCAVSLALWPHFFKVLRTRNTVGLNPFISLFHATICLILVMAASFMIPGSSPTNKELADPELLITCGALILFFNLIPLFGHTIVAVLKILNQKEAKKLHMTEAQYYEEKMSSRSK